MVDCMQGLSDALSVGERTCSAGSLLDAERDAPEQIRHHFISRQLVLSWIRQQRGEPSHHLAGLAKRLHVV